MERAEDFYFDGVQDFPLDYSSALKASAARYRTEFIEVNELDDYVIHMAVDVDIDDELDENKSEKGPDFSMTTDTASMMSSQTTEATGQEQKTLNDENEIEDEDAVEKKEEMSERQDDYELRDASLDKKASFLMGRYLDERHKIDEALVDLESELIAELKRLDNEATECNLKHKIEADRIKKDKIAVEEKAIEDEKKMKEQAKVLREKLSSTVAVLEFDVKRTMSGMDTIDREAGKDGSQRWGWFNAKPKKITVKEKEKQDRLKQREAKLEKEVADIRAQLDFLNHQAKAKKRSISDWKAELDDEYRHLEDLRSATEAKLKEEMRYLRASYEEEKERLLNQRNYLEEIKSGDEQWIVSEKEKIGDLYGSLQGCIAGAENESYGSKNDEEDPDDRTVGLQDEGGEELDQANVAREGILTEPSTPIVPGEKIPRDRKEDDANFNTTEQLINDITHKNTSDGRHEEDDYIHSNGTGPAEDDCSEKVSIEIDGNPLMVNTTGDSDVPNHLASLNQPREIKDEASLGSVEIFDLPEAGEVSRMSLSEAARKAKSDEESKTKVPEHGNGATAGHIASEEPQKKSEETLLHESPIANTSTTKKLSSKKFLAVALKGKEESDSAEAEIEVPLKSESSLDRIPLTPVTPHTPGKSLRDMRRKVEEALERAMAIRNGESSSRHSRSIALPFESDESGRDGRSVRSQCFSPLSTSRQSANPIHPMIRETDRLSGFIRRYEKKLETVCKSLLTLASVTRDEKEILAARQYELPEMLEFVVNQDWYKEHSKDAESDPPHLLFSKSKKETGKDSVGDNRYTVTATGKVFLEIDGPVPSDISRFLTYLNKIEDGLTRDSMKGQWKEIAQLSGDEQSQRVCDNLDKLISFCVESQMIKN